MSVPATKSDEVKDGRMPRQVGVKVDGLKGSYTKCLRGHCGRTSENTVINSSKYGGLVLIASGIFTTNTNGSLNTSPHPTVAVSISRRIPEGANHTAFPCRANLTSDGQEKKTDTPMR